MYNSQFLEGEGPLETRYLAFLETISSLRPSLHRYCARMTGSVLDGEDVVQEALFEAYRKLDKFDEGRPLKPWLFRIAHNRCIDFLRRKGVRDEAAAVAGVREVALPTDAPVLGIGKAIEHLVAVLPPKERASILLKDVFDYPLEEIADLTDSTVGGVKAALNRARTKLAEASPPLKSARRASPELRQLMQLYVDRFNRREPVVLILKRGADAWTPYSAIRFDVIGQRIDRILDYIHCPWVIEAATTVTIGEVPQA